MSDMRRCLSLRDVMPTRAIPEDGDIVIRQEEREGILVYVLHTVLLNTGSAPYVSGRARSRGMHSRSVSGSGAVFAQQGAIPKIATPDT